MKSFSEFYKTNDNSYTNQLTCDPETQKYWPNKTSREVLSGHYVLVNPTPLPDPFLITYDTTLAKQLNLSDEQMKSSDMLKFLSGHNYGKSWSTPYALSIYGEEMISNCPFKSGNGYGDGRAHTIGEFVIDGKRWELQLKGSGKSPFSRAGDGRAVLRSSIREYLASQAMYNMKVPTTRILSLIVSKSEKINRQWYDDDINPISKSVNGTCPLKKSVEIVKSNPATITCRVSESLIRVGHLELFSRRARKDPARLKELELMFRHTVFREYSQFINLPLHDMILHVLKEFNIKMAEMISGWLRVGYVQSNFNSDNCLVSGRTMDYGPFGFIEKYDPNKNFWVGSGDHFAFMNQPQAGIVNFTTFANSLKPLVSNQYKKNIDEMINVSPSVMNEIVNKMWSRKLGLVKIRWDEGVGNLFNKLDKLMEKSNIDYTMFWRELTNYPLILLSSIDYMNTLYQELDPIVLRKLNKAFYKPLSGELTKEWLEWLAEYQLLLRYEKRDPVIISMEMKQQSPKYIPREWMLVKAYTQAEAGDFEYLHLLEKLFKQPYEEQYDLEGTFYILQSLDVIENKAGTAFMTCSS